MSDVIRGKLDQAKGTLSEYNNAENFSDMETKKQEMDALLLEIDNDLTALEEGIDEQEKQKLQKELYALELDFENQKKSILANSNLGKSLVENEVLFNDNQKLKGVADDILAMEDVTEEQKRSIADCLEKGDFIGAIDESLSLVSRYFGGGRKIETGHNEFDQREEKLSNINFKTMEKDEISSYIEKLQRKVNSTADMKKKIHFTFVLSAFKKEYLRKEEPEISEYNLLKQNIEPGTVLLINYEAKGERSKKAEYGSLALANYNDDLQTRYTHSVVVSRIDGDEVYITHSTMNKVNGGEGGVEEVKLSTLLGKYKAADILALDMPQKNKDKTLDYVKKKLDDKASYDDGVALYDQLGGGTTVADTVGGFVARNQNVEFKDDPEKVNCVELIAEGMGIDNLKDISDPNDFLDGDHLKPTYLTTIEDV